MERVKEHRERVEEKVPSQWMRAFAEGRERNLPILAAGLAFFGLISVGPATAVGFAVLQLVASPEAADAVVELFEDTMVDRFGLVDILQEMEEQGAQYAGFSLLFLLWPATTLASGWTRALNSIFDSQAQGPAGLKGRLRGIAPGAVLISSLFLLFLSVSFGTALLGEGVLLALVIVPGAIAMQMAFNLVIYRYLPSDRLAWRDLWRGAALATAGVVVGTLAFAAVLEFSQGFAEEYPEQLTTAIILGFWLYVLNTAMLVGAEYNAARTRDQAR